MKDASHLLKLINISVQDVASDNPPKKGQYNVSTDRKRAYDERRARLNAHIQSVKLFNISTSLFLHDKHDNVLMYYFRQPPGCESVARYLTSIVDDIHPKHFYSNKAVRRHVDDNTSATSKHPCALHFGVHEVPFTARVWNLFHEIDDSFEVLQQIHPLVKYVEELLKLTNRAAFDKQYNLSTYNLKLCTPGNSIFQQIAMNKIPTSIHTDDNEHISAILIGGDDFKGGELIIHQLNLRLLVKPGDVIFMGADFIHTVDIIHGGKRYSLSMYSKKIHFKAKSTGTEIQLHNDVVKLCNSLK